jgi:hypothetical protein
VSGLTVHASIGSFFDAVGEFFASLAKVDLVSLVIALAAFGIYLALRSRAWFNVLRAAYPDVAVQCGASGAPTWPPTASTTSSRPAAATS